jgi:hypothetical protein
MIPVVDGAAADVASLIASPIPLKSDDALANASGAMFRKDDISGSNHLRTVRTSGQYLAGPHQIPGIDQIFNPFPNFHFNFI